MWMHGLMKDNVSPPSFSNVTLLKITRKSFWKLLEIPFEKSVRNSLEYSSFYWGAERKWKQSCHQLSKFRGGGWVHLDYSISSSEIDQKVGRTMTYASLFWGNTQKHYPLDNIQSILFPHNLAMETWMKITCIAYTLETLPTNWHSS